MVDADDLMYSIVQDAKSTTQERGHIEGMSESERENLYSTIGLGGLKYFLLKVDPKKGMVFDPKESIDLNGNLDHLYNMRMHEFSRYWQKQNSWATVNRLQLLKPTKKKSG